MEDTRHVNTWASRLTHTLDCIERKKRIMKLPDAELWEKEDNADLIQLNDVVTFCVKRLNEAVNNYTNR